jgi:diguanylate cyclase (GGDEF)-like protein
MLPPACAHCGGTLRSVPEAEVERARREDADVRFEGSRRHDGTGVFAVMIVLPWLLPLIGVDMGDVVFVIPAVLCAFGAGRAFAASRRDRAWSRPWFLLGVATALAAGASVLGLAQAVLADGTGDLALYVGASATVGLIATALVGARRALSGVRRETLVDAALLCLVLAAVGVYGVIVPGLNHGDAALTVIVVGDLVALLLMALSAVALGAGRHQPAPWWLVFSFAAVMLGDALASASAAGQIGELPALTAVLWGVAGYGVAVAAEAGSDAAPRPARHDVGGAAWVLWRVALPLCAVLSFPAIALWLWVGDALPSWGAVYFGAFFLLSLVLAFGRQAALLVGHRKMVLRERRIRREATRRNAELEALTGLATTMTQTLEEAPIVEQALGVLQTAARATSAALLLPPGDHGARELAASGEWVSERVWVDTAPVEAPTVGFRGGRAILRLPLGARGKHIGTVALVRRAGADAFDAKRVELLRLLVDQLGVAVQNARDYREKLEQAIRDPLTGVYNRRFLLEAVEKEVHRSQRYGSNASLVIFDVDDFKRINDTLGHGTGDDVLRSICATVEALIRPSDSFARIGGEEFALLLPETGQLEGLLVAERIRTAISRREILPGHRVTVSGGVACSPSDASSAEELQKRADAALYWSKRNGKDLCAVASEVAVVHEENGSDAVLSHLYGLVAMIDAQHLHTRDHSENVAAYAVALGDALGLEREQVVRLRRAAMLHDVGKVAVSSEVLSKPDRLTDEEFELIRAHPVVGGMMLSHAGLRDEAAWVRHHHERADGRGYPDGLTLAEIPLEARILFVADAFEAMTSDRPYSAGVPVADALLELRRCAGTQFDPDIVAQLCELVEGERLSVQALRDRPARDAAA